MIGIVQFYISRLAAEAVQIGDLKFCARARGMETAAAEISYYRTGGRCRVTCKSPVAELLVIELEAAIAGATKEAIRAACVEALSTIRKELERTSALSGAPLVQRGTADDGRSVIGCWTTSRSRPTTATGFVPRWKPSGLNRGNDLVVVATHDVEVIELLGGTYTRCIPESRLERVR